MLDKMNAIEEAIVVGIFPSDRLTDYIMPGYENYGRFFCQNAQAANRGKISHAQWASEYRRRGIISRWRRDVLSRNNMAGGMWESCPPSYIIYLSIPASDGS